MKYLSLRDVEQVAFSLAQETLNWHEPIPDLATRYPDKLEGCLEAPRQSFGNKDLYRGLLNKAAILFYLLIKNHYFQNGNKRIAITTLLVFLYRNGKWIKVDTQELYNFTKWVAASNPKLKDNTVQAVHDFLKLYLTNNNAN
ncbi:MAG: type II toxin-antitoxin system death-on-curing family toxin [Candidatus Komeilibacteria bacterium]